MRPVLYLLVFLSLCTSSCSAKKDTLVDSKLLIAIEARDFNHDTVTEYKFFDNGLKQTLITHGSKEKLFQNSFSQLDTKQLEKLKTFSEALKKLDYENFFPWKEGLYERGNVYKISFVASKELEYLKRSKGKASNIDTEKILYFYEGHQESPLIFKDLVSFIK